MSQIVRVAAKSEIEAGEAKVVEVGKKTISVFNLDGEYFAIDEYCPHAGGPLSEGYISGEEVECPWHNAAFNIKTGECTSPPSPCGVTSYPVKIEGEDISVEVEEE